MRLVFISSTTGGGSGRSQRELVRRLIARGHEVDMIVDDKRPARLVRWWFEQVSDCNARFERWPLRRARAWVEGIPGARPKRMEIGGVAHSVSPVPQNVWRRTPDDAAPDLVVGNSVQPFTWRRVREACAERGIPTLLYVREVATFGMIERLDDPADAFVANASSLAAGVEERGYECPVIPSVIDVSTTRVESTRTVALVVNPIETHGVEFALALADSLPTIRFAFQESWPLDPDAWQTLERRVRRLANVELRPRVGPGPELYADAHVLLVPHRIDNRPRVVAEAQANGIPVLASAQPGLAEAVGPGGLVLPGDDLESWRTALLGLWADDARYADLRVAALGHSRRDEIDPDRVVDAFVELAASVVEAGVDRTTSRTTTRTRAGE